MEKSIKHICFVAEGYPTKNEPVYTFVKQLISSIADMGIKCTVIVPQSISTSILKGKEERPTFWVDKSKKGAEIEVHQPKYISLSSLKIFNSSVSKYFWNKAVNKAFNIIKERPDVLYGHFWHSAIELSRISKDFNIPLFIASGESKIKVRELFNKPTIDNFLTEVNGVICVSSKNFIESFELGLSDKENMMVIPNAIDDELFFKEEKTIVRDKLGIQEHDFVVAFTGSFTHRKGVLRLSEAVNKLENVKAIYIGAGDQEPTGDNILFSGKVHHDQIVHYLNAADIFVLPTLAEGCSNAIIEAMACGLPIVSSNLKFNDDILNCTNSIRVDSYNVNEISNAIIALKENPERLEMMSKSSLEIANSLNIKVRAKRIIEYMENQMVKNSVI